MQGLALHAVLGMACFDTRLGGSEGLREPFALLLARLQLSLVAVERVTHHWSLTSRRVAHTSIVRARGVRAGGSAGSLYPQRAELCRCLVDRPASRLHGVRACTRQAHVACTGTTGRAVGRKNCSGVVHAAHLINPHVVTHFLFEFVVHSEAQCCRGFAEQLAS